MKKEKMYKIGKKLGISETNVKAALMKNRNKIAAGIIIAIAALMTNRIWFEPLHYNGGSLMDLNFFTRFL
jgi:LysM repeat protein